MRREFCVLHNLVHSENFINSYSSGKCRGEVIGHSPRKYEPLLTSLESLPSRPGLVWQSLRTPNPGLHI